MRVRFGWTLVGVHVPTVRPLITRVLESALGCVGPANSVPSVTRN